MSSRTAIAGIAVALVTVLLINGGCGSGDGTVASTAAISSAPGIGAPPKDTAASDLAAKVPVADQRAEVARVLRLIASGKPLPYDQDGSVFQNREGNLPDLPSNLLYREYTVPTPGSPDRGARRLVIGDDGSVYYTSDHYSKFTRLDE
jgi:ribonuclease T1